MFRVAPKVKGYTSALKAVNQKCENVYQIKEI